MGPESRLFDTPNGYGWISIALHWAGALLVLFLLFVGSSISGEQGDGMLRLHTSTAIAAYLLLWVRVLWRFRVGHPGPLAKQGRMSFAVGKAVHYVLLVAIGVMLLSGPLMAWTGGIVISVFDWFTVPSPIPLAAAVSDALRRIHTTAATVIGVATGLHIAGVLKHMMFNRDGTFDKIMAPPRLPQQRAPHGAAGPDVPTSPTP